jgi:hypothetical protein
MNSRLGQLSTMWPAHEIARSHRKESITVKIIRNNFEPEAILSAISLQTAV